MKVHLVTVKVRIVGRAHALIEPAQSRKNYTKKASAQQINSTGDYGRKKRPKHSFSSIETYSRMCSAAFSQV
jgi:hypothetical protein